MLANGEPDLTKEDLINSQLLHAELKFTDYITQAKQDLKHSMGMMAVGGTLLAGGEVIDGITGGLMKSIGYAIFGTGAVIGIIKASDYIGTQRDYKEQIQNFLQSN